MLIDRLIDGLQLPDGLRFFFHLTVQHQPHHMRQELIVEDVLHVFFPDGKREFFIQKTHMNPRIHMCDFIFSEETHIPGDRRQGQLKSHRISFFFH